MFAGNGSDEVLAFAFLAFCEKGAAFADITYGFYPVFAQLFGIAAQEVPLREDFSVNTGDYAGVPGTVFPGKPQRAHGPVPAAGGDRGAPSAGPGPPGGGGRRPMWISAERVPPACWAGTTICWWWAPFPKAEASRARLGYAVGSPALIADLNTVKFSFNPYNINRLTLLAGEAALADAPYRALLHAGSRRAGRDGAGPSRVGLHSDRQQKQTFCSRARIRLFPEGILCSAAAKQHS